MLTSINCMNCCKLSSKAWCLWDDRRGAWAAAGVRGWVSAVWGWAQALCWPWAQNWTCISTLLGKEEPRIMPGLRTCGHCDKNPKTSYVLLFAPSFFSDFCCGLCVWRCFLIYLDLIREWKFFVSCTLACQELKISPEILSNIYSFFLL